MGEQRLMRAAILDIAVVHDVDPFRVCDGGETVGNDDQRLTRGQLRHRALDHRLVFRVGVGSGLVQDHDGRGLEHRPGDGNALALAAGQVPAGGAHQRVIAMLQTQYELVAAAVPGGSLHLGVRRAGAAQADVLPNGHVEQVVVLADEGHPVGVGFL